MVFDTDLIVVFSFPIIVIALSMAYAAYQRHLKHKERMAMIEKGILPVDFDARAVAQDFAQDVRARYKRTSSSPIGITLIGIAITLGLFTIGIGPWLIGGLVPTAIGCAMLMQQLIEESRKKRDGE